jgi:tRNA nucleotidyltransferase/poly(A) polymerase
MRRSPTTSPQQRTIKRPRLSMSSASNSLLVPKIELTEQENNLFTLVRTVTNPVGITVRVAGGWVRDKVCGKESHDIDFAVDKDPAELVNAVRKYCHEVLNDETMISGVGTVQENAEKGKNLQTETFILMGFPIDVVPLRTQGSPDKNRRIGTPQEDVLYRDFTINALFYNVSSQEVEDFLPEQIGLKDLLNNHVVRTPIPAAQTLYDDPIRAVRAARFATKMNFEVDEGIATAAMSDAVQSRLSKASRERFGLEVMKMVEGRDFLRSMRLLCSWNLFEIVFLPESIASPSEDSKEAASCLSSLESYYRWKSLGIERVPFLYQLDDELKRSIPLAAFLLSLKRDPVVKTKKPRSIQWHIIADALKVKLDLLYFFLTSQSAPPQRWRQRRKVDRKCQTIFKIVGASNVFFHS